MNPQTSLPWPVLPAELMERLGWCLLHFLWQGAALAAGLALLLRLCQKGTPELRHALCGMALLGMAVAPLATWMGLDRGIPYPTKVSAIASPAPTLGGGLSDSLPTEPVRKVRTLLLPGNALDEAPAEEFPDDSSAVPAEKTDGTAVPPSWLRWLGWFWLAGAALVAAWRAIGLCATARLIRKAAAAPDRLLQHVAAMAALCGLRKAPLVKITGRLMSPAVAGMLRPVLILPAAALAGLSPRELDFILAHEFAHIRRHDFLLGLLQAAVETLFFFHPAVWWVSHYMAVEREHACDDTAMRVTGNRSAGAAALARLGELQLQANPYLALAAGSGPLLQRVRRLLDPPHPPRRGSLMMLVPLLLLGLVLTPFLFQRAESQDAATLAASGVSNIAGEAAAIPLMRGSITDRNGVVLAESIQSTWVHNGETFTGERRHYPLGVMASHVIGYTQQGPGEVEPDKGRSGIEKSADSLLRSMPAPDGKPQSAVALTIDARMQQICRKALVDAGVGRGTAVVLDITNGDILSMASVPDFDPNQCVPFLTTEVWKELNGNPAAPLINRAVSAYPPCSTFKLITALAAGGSGDWERNFNCSGAVTYGGRSFNCWTVQTQTASHGILALPEALRCSCNCYFYQLGNAVGIDAISRMAKNFGLGEISSFRLGASMTDFMPDRGWWELQNMGPWTEAKTANVAIGQGEVQATPLQMAGVAAAIANGGKIWNPRIISRTLVNGVWQAASPDLRHDLIAEGVSAETVDAPHLMNALRQGMHEVVHAETGGTGTRAASNLIAIAGKTGTAQKYRIDQTTGKTLPDNHTQFIGFAPFEKPRYAFSIVVANGKSGGAVCAPIAKRIMESIELLDRGELEVELKAELPVRGHFDFIESVTYPDDIK